MTWKEALPDKKFQLQAILTLIILSGVLFSLTNFLNFIETRLGVILPDPLLRQFNPVNLTWLIFGLIYLSLILALGYIVRYPDQLLILLQSYSLLIIVRIFAMYLLPLNPPQYMIPLNDPFVQYFGTGKVLTKDLFFSGHTATLFLLFLGIKNSRLKTIFLICTVMVGIAVLIQHVHYSIDVLAAPFFSFACYKTILFAHIRYLKY